MPYNHCVSNPGPGAERVFLCGKPLVLGICPIAGICAGGGVAEADGAKGQGCTVPVYVPDGIPVGLRGVGTLPQRGCFPVGCLGVSVCVDIVPSEEGEGTLWAA